MLVREKRVSWSAWAFPVLLFLVPLTIGAGFGVLSWQHAARLIGQWNADRAGAPIAAAVFATKIEEVQHSSGSGVTAGGPRYGSTSYFCHIAVTYQDPGDGEIRRKPCRLEDDAVCDRYKADDPIPAMAAPGRPEFTVLDEGRLSPLWLVVTVAISVLFIGSPVYLFLRARRARRQSDK